MYLKKLFSLRRTLAFRLTLWYAGIFTLCFLGAFIFLYFLIISDIQTRTDQGLLDEGEEFSSLLALKGIDELKTGMVLEAESEGVNKIFFRLLEPNGKVLASSNASSWEEVGQGREILNRLNGGKRYEMKTVVLPGRKHRVRMFYGIIGPGIILQICQSLEDDERFMGAFRQIFWISMSVLLIVSALIGWFMARRALLGVEEVTHTAMEISGGALERRVPVKARGDEIDRLATTFNKMLDRIHSLVTGMRDVTDNIAHDLRSPVARIRGIAEMTLTTGETMNEYEVMSADIIEECDRLLEMINTMLDISEAEAGASQLEMKRINIAKVVREACDLFQPVAETKEISIVTKVPEISIIFGDIKRIQRMVANLLDNAVKYTLENGTVMVSLKENDRQSIISIEENGIGISESDLPHIFERFYRCDSSRSQPGFGLGLSFAVAVAQAHGGDIRASSQQNKGSKFKIILPKGLSAPKLD
ncbi:sensor histidine kinase [Thermodesulfobacteriota bacterium]